MFRSVPSSSSKTRRTPYPSTRRPGATPLTDSRGSCSRGFSQTKTSRIPSPPVTPLESLRRMLNHTSVDPRPSSLNPRTSYPGRSPRKVSGYRSTGTTDETSPEGVRPPPPVPSGSPRQEADGSGTTPTPSKEPLLYFRLPQQKWEREEGGRWGETVLCLFNLGPRSKVIDTSEPMYCNVESRVKTLYPSY